MNIKKSTKIRLLTHGIIGASLILILGSFLAFSEYRYGIIRDNPTPKYFFWLAVIPLWIVLSSFANYIILEGEKREAYGLSFFESPISFLKITLKSLAIISCLIMYFWPNIKDIDMNLRGKYYEVNNVTFKGFGKYSFSSYSYYIFETKEKNTITLRTSHMVDDEYNLISNQKISSVYYLPNTMKLLNIQR